MVVVEMVVVEVMMVVVVEMLGSEMVVGMGVGVVVITKVVVAVDEGVKVVEVLTEMVGIR